MIRMKTKAIVEIRVAVPLEVPARHGARNGRALVNDLMKAALPLAIRGGVDSLMKGFRLSLVFEFAALVVSALARQGHFPILDARDPDRLVARHRVRPAQRAVLPHLISSRRISTRIYRTGDIMARATNDLNAVRMMLGPGIMYFTETFFTAVFLIGVMCRVDWRLTLFCLIPAPLVSAGRILFGRRIHDRFETIQKMFSDISSRVQENLSGVRVIRAYAQEQPEMRKFETLNQDYVPEHPSRQAFRAFHAAAASADRDRVPDGAAGRRLSVARAPHFTRQFRHVQHLHGHAGLAHDRARLGGESDAARHRFLEPHHGADG